MEKMIKKLNGEKRGRAHRDEYQDDESQNSVMRI